MSIDPDPQVSANLIEQLHKQINRLVDEISKLSEQDLSPSEYYGEFLQRVLTAIAAPAGAVWIRTSQGNLQLQYQVNLRQVGLEKSEAGRQSHDELLRQAAIRAQPLMLPPQSGTGTADEKSVAPGNPTDYVILLAPILVDKQVAGLVEVWQDSNRHPNAQRGFLQFLVRVAELATVYTRNHRLRTMVGQQTLWTQLEAFSRQIHSTLHTTEVAYLTANEGRRLIECDRVSVAVRHGRRTKVEAVSGADTVEKRSNLIQLMRKLFDAVIKWGEKLTFSGTKDDSLPPDVIAALDAYLAESNSKLLVVLPLRDEREEDKEHANFHRNPPRSAMLMECFEPTLDVEQMTTRMEVVGRHAASALYNAVEHRRIPMRFLWEPIAKVQEGLGGKTRAIIYSVAAAVIVLILCMVFIPYPLKMEAKGPLLPKERIYLYPPVAGSVKAFAVKPGAMVKQGQSLVKMVDNDLAMKIETLEKEIQGAEAELDALNHQLSAGDPRDNVKVAGDIAQKNIVLRTKRRDLENLRKRTESDTTPGEFWLKAPLGGKILSADFQESLINRYVSPSEPLLRIGNELGQWEVELKIPQKHVGQVLRAFERKAEERRLRVAAGEKVDEAFDELDVDLLLRSDPTATYKGKLKRSAVAGEANPNKDDNNEPEPVVTAWVRISGDDIPESSRIPASELKTGVDVVGKIRCGNRAMGYSLFYGVWEFLYEKVVFFF